MKKKIVALLMCVALLATAVVFVACGPTSLVDTSGNYKESTVEEVTKLLEGKAVETTGSYEISLNMTAEVGGASGKVDYTAIMAGDSSGVVTMSGNVNMESKAADGTTMKINSAFYKDSEYMYITVAGEKVKMPAMQGDQTVPTYVIPTGELLQYLQDAEGVKLEVAESGDITKIKMSSTVEGEGSSTIYIVLEKGEFAGIKMSGGQVETGMTLTLEMVPTSKTVTVPTDLDQYKEQQ